MGHTVWSILYHHSIKIQVRPRNHIENLLIEIPSESIIIPSINCSNPATDSLR